MPTEPSKQVAFRFPTWLVDWLDAEADRRQIALRMTVTRADVVRQIVLDTYDKAHQAQHEQEKQYKHNKHL